MKIDPTKVLREAAEKTAARLKQANAQPAEMRAAMALEVIAEEATIIRVYLGMLTGILATK